MIYLDNVHMVSDVSVDELHEFAKNMGLKRCWFHGVRKKHPHYDLTTLLRVQDAIANGAIKTDSKHIVKICKSTYDSHSNKI